MIFFSTDDHYYGTIPVVEKVKKLTGLIFDEERNHVNASNHETDCVSAQFDIWWKCP